MVERSHCKNRTFFLCDCGTKQPSERKALHSYIIAPMRLFLMNDAFNEKKHILVISGEPRILAELKMGLLDVFDVGIVSAASSASAALETYETAAVIIHVSKGHDGRELALSVFKGIAEHAKHNFIPVLLLAEEDNAADEHSALAAGAADYAVRRAGGSDALIKRINLRIRSSENERRILSESGEKQRPAFDPQTVLSNKTILVVDDVELNRIMIEGMLSGISDLTVDFAEDGEDAVKKYEQAPTRYSLILMDVQMPVMNGTEATAIIRNLPFENARDIPIIALTAGVEEEETASYLKAGMTDFLKKPMDYGEFLKMAVKYCV